MMCDDNYVTNLFEHFSNSNTQYCDTFQCYFTSTTLNSLDWISAYNNDINTRFITSKLLDSHQVDWNDKDLFKVNSMYRSPLKNNTIQVVNTNLVISKPILTKHWYVMLIIVSISLRYMFFSHYHADRSGDHMGEYKKLYWIWLICFWPKLREDIKQWIKSCAHCVSYNFWHSHR